MVSVLRGIDNVIAVVGKDIFTGEDGSVVGDVFLFDVRFPKISFMETSSFVVLSVAGSSFLSSQAANAMSIKHAVKIDAMVINVFSC